MTHAPGCILLGTHAPPCLTESQIQEQHRTGCGCEVCRGVTVAESLACLGGEQGVTADEMEIDRLRARAERAEAAFVGACARIEEQDAELTHRLLEMDRWSDAALNAGEERDELRARVRDLESQLADAGRDARLIATDRRLEESERVRTLEAALNTLRASAKGHMHRIFWDELDAAVETAIRARGGG